MNCFSNACSTYSNARGFLKSRGKQRTDSTYLLGVLRKLNRLERIGESLRYTLNELARHYPTWLSPLIEADWLERYGHRIDDYPLPKSQEARQALADAIGADGQKLLKAAKAPETPSDLSVLPALETLRRIWEQEFYWEGETLRWRADQERAVSMQLIQSPYEQEARYAFKHSTTWIGYKVHLTETCDEDTPQLIVNVKTSLATSPDQNTLPSIHKNLAQRDLLPAQQLVDAGYTDLDSVITLVDDYQVQVVGPLKPSSAWQSRVEGAYQNSDFNFDWAKHKATCPQGKTTRYWQLFSERGENWLQVRFHKRDCDPCSVRALCTRAKNESRSVRVHLEHERIKIWRQEQETEQWKTLYRERAGIEGTISQSLRVTGLRQARYVGLARTHLQDILSASAVNLIRVDNWLSGAKRLSERVTPFQKLCTSCA